jgi:hypothetical protein
MAFPNNGVVTAPGITPSAYGLLSVIKPENSADEDQWVRGFSQEWETELYSAKNWDDTDTTSATITTNATPLRHERIKPFFIEVEDNLSTLGFTGLDRIARITRQLEGITQKAIERELWDGAVRKGQSHDNKALTSNSSVKLSNSQAMNVNRALAVLEQYVSTDSPCGEQGVIHMTRDTAALLAREGQIFMHDAERDRLTTINGTLVVVGSGYTGTGPDTNNHATPSDSNKWMYATGTVKVYLGKVDVVNDGLNQAYNVSGNQNDMRLKAIRPAAVYFDSSIHLAVRVDLTA